MSEDVVTCELKDLIHSGPKANPLGRRDYMGGNP
jgi:hypothetical protein